MELSLWPTLSADAQAPLSAEALGLGPGLVRGKEGLQRIGRYRLRSPGGVEVELSGDGVRLRHPGAPELAIDAKGRFLAQGRPLTAAAPFGFALRFLDGSELRFVPGRGRRLQLVELVDGGTSELLLRNGRAQIRRLRARPFEGARYYLCEGGRSVLELSRFGPWLLLRPLLVNDGASRRSRLHFIGQLWQASNYKLAEIMPLRSAQYPLSRKHVVAVAEATSQLLLSKEAKKPRRYLARKGEPLVLPLGPEFRVQLLRGQGGIDFVTRLQLASGAPETLELLISWRKETLHRVLPPARQMRGRYVGNGLDFAKLAAKRLAWAMPLDSPGQRRQARDWLQKQLPPAAQRRQARDWLQKQLPPAAQRR